MHLDTTMAFTDFTEQRMPFPPDLRPRLLDLGDRVVLGTDFPNTPYPYAHQLEALVAPRPRRRLAARACCTTTAPACSRLAWEPRSTD